MKARDRLPNHKGGSCANRTGLCGTNERVGMGTAWWRRGVRENARVGTAPRPEAADHAICLTTGRSLERPYGFNTADLVRVAGGAVKAAYSSGWGRVCRMAA